MDRFEAVPFPAAAGISWGSKPLGGTLCKVVAQPGPSCEKIGPGLGRFGPFAQSGSGGFRVGGQGTSGFGNLELAEAGLKQYLIFTGLKSRSWLIHVELRGKRVMFLRFHGNVDRVSEFLPRTLPCSRSPCTPLGSAEESSLWPAPRTSRCTCPASASLRRSAGSRWFVFHSVKLELFFLLHWRWIMFVGLFGFWVLFICSSGLPARKLCATVLWGGRSPSVGWHQSRLGICPFLPGA